MPAKTGIQGNRWSLAALDSRFRVGKQALDRTLEFAPVDQLPADHHRGLVERAHGQDAQPQLLRY